MSALWEATGGCCWFCGRAVAREQRSVDHLTPRSRGGTNAGSNLVPACRACNGEKWDMTLEEFREHARERLSALLVEGLFFGERLTRERHRTSFEWGVFREKLAAASQRGPSDAS